MSPSLTINHPGPTGAATLNAAFAGKWVNDTAWNLHIRDDDSGGIGSLNSFGIAVTYNLVTKPHDFNGTFTGSASDILWQNSDGTAGIWLMNGLTATSVGSAGPHGAWPYNPGPSWHIKGDADFDFDGKSDILWQNDDGTPGIWLIDGLTAVSHGRGRHQPPDRPGTSRAPATSISTAGPTSCGRTTTARRASG